MARWYYGVVRLCYVSTNKPLRYTRYYLNHCCLIVNSVWPSDNICCRRSVSTRSHLSWTDIDFFIPVHYRMLYWSIGYIRSHGWLTSQCGVSYEHIAVITLRWRHNMNDVVSNHLSHHCLLNRLFGCKSKKTSKFRVTGLCAGNSPETGEFPAQMASNAEDVSIWWRHHENVSKKWTS